MPTFLYLLDTSALLSGKPLNFSDGKLVTCSAIVNELQPGGRDYRNLEFLQARGLSIEDPSKEAIQHIEKHIQLLGESIRLSKADKHLLALAYTYKQSDCNPILLTDDYSIQNLASHLAITYRGLSQKGIAKRFKWYWRCPGCNKTFDSYVERCPICGKEPKQKPRSLASVQNNGESV